MCTWKWTAGRPLESWSFKASWTVRDVCSDYSKFQFATKYEFGRVLHVLLLSRSMHSVQSPFYGQCPTELHSKLLFESRKFMWFLFWLLKDWSIIFARWDRPREFNWLFSKKIIFAKRLSFLVLRQLCQLRPSLQPFELPDRIIIIVRALPLDISTRYIESCRICIRYRPHGMSSKLWGLKTPKFRVNR